MSLLPRRGRLRPAARVRLRLQGEFIGLERSADHCVIFESSCVCRGFWVSRAPHDIMKKTQQQQTYQRRLVRVSRASCPVYVRTVLIVEILIKARAFACARSLLGTLPIRTSRRTGVSDVLADSREFRWSMPILQPPAGCCCGQKAHRVVSFIFDTTKIIVIARKLSPRPTVCCLL